MFSADDVVKLSFYEQAQSLPTALPRSFKISMETQREFTPKLFSLIKTGIDRKQLLQDVVSGLIVGIVALPLAIAFAIGSGVSPEKGLVTAVVAGFLISAFGGSRVQIGGPTGAFIVIVYGIVQQHGVDGLIIATFLAGLIIIAFGLLRFGNLLKYIPQSLIVGFTSGIAVIIFSQQIKDFFGLQTGTVPADFLEKWHLYFSHFNSVNLYAVGLGAFSVAATFFLPKLTGKIPGSLVAIVVCTLAVQFLNLPVETIESKFGEIPRSLPAPHLPAVDFKTIQELINPAFAIAILGALESLLSAVVADGMIGGRNRSNMELVAQGVGNIGSSLFGGIPATGAIARTATNVKNGGRTPIAGIVHALTLLLIMLLFAPYAKLISLSCLAGVLIVVAYNMGEWHSFFSVVRGNRYDALVLLTTFFLTVLFDLIVAIEIGMVLTAFIFMKRMSDIAHFNVLDTRESEDLFSEKDLKLPEDAMIYEINSPLFFGVTQKFQATLNRISETPKTLIIRMRNVPLIDASGVYRLKEVVKEYEQHGTKVFITEPQKPVLDEIIKNGILPETNIKKSLDEAIKAINAAA
jgi:SulP family sulfate permease